MPNIHVEICYASTTQQSLLSVQVPENSTIKNAIIQSGILDQFTELDCEELVVGIFSKKCELSNILKEGDRVEIYRPLTIDPKTARRLRAEKKRKAISKS